MKKRDREIFSCVSDVLSWNAANDKHNINQEDRIFISVGISSSKEIILDFISTPHVGGIGRTMKLTTAIVGVGLSTTVLVFGQQW